MCMNLVLLSKQPGIHLLSKEAYKRYLRQLLGIKRGPDSVLSSILRGLNELNFPFEYNPAISDIKPDDIVLVNGSIEALKRMIKEKQRGRFGKLVTGPNMVVTPDDYEGVINSPEIDTILQPSDWVKDFYVSVSPQLVDKIKVWPAGVSVPPDSDKRRSEILIYLKHTLEEKQLDLIKKSLGAHPYRIINYRDYKQSDYFYKLEKAKVMIYISLSESQGLALQEAWVRDVPTLVWDRGLWEYNGYSWKAKKISCPYLNDMCGMTFSNISNFKSAFDSCLDRLDQYRPRQYVTQNLTDKKSVELMLDIIGIR